ncbi:hypothetical protein E4U41_007620 [Claviceps citrina]|nr:hypothetical protein E4U41_007620 [Claviceps citrina]
MGEVKAQVRFSHVVALLLSAGTALVYSLTESSLLSNLLGCGMCYGSFLVLSPTDFLTGSLVLWGLFFYDVVMVFYTPYMMTVATTLEIPIKVTLATGWGKSMLGLGDIVIPGMMIGWALRLDLWLHYVRKIKYEATDLLLVERDPSSGELVRRSETKHREIKAPYVDVRGSWGDGLWSRGAMCLSRARRQQQEQQQLPHLAGARFAKVYFHAALAGYALGMAVTIAVLRISRHGQPALLYLVPGVLGAMAVTAWARGELADLCRYTEDGSLDTKDVVVDLDGQGNAVRRLGPLENGVVDTTAAAATTGGDRTKTKKAKKEKEEEAEQDEDRAVNKAGDGKGEGRRRRVFVLSIEAADE